MIFYRGDDDFAASAAPEWNQQIFDLDTLTEKYRGGREKLDTFLNSLVRFQPSAIDPNMFLVNWSVTGGTSVFPEVSLVFNGKKNGIMPFGRRSTDTKTQTSSATTPFGPITITYRVRTPIYEWVSVAEGVGGAALPDTIVSAATTTYLIEGILTIRAGSDIMGVNSPNAADIRVGDRIQLLLHDPTIPISGPTNISVILAIKAIISPTLFQLTQVQTISASNYAFSTTTKPSAIGYHSADLPVTVINVRMGCGITPISGAFLDLIGPILVASYFAAIITPDLTATEVVPDKYWKNRQELVTSLLPLPC